jgi:hypothetical protein
MKKTLVVSLCLLLVASFAMARSVDKGTSGIRPMVATDASDNNIPELGIQPSAAQVGTTFLAYYTFDSGPNCVTEGWSKIDGTSQLGDYWHVDDFAGLADYSPLAGLQSLWCGARPDAGSLILCGYAALPGYGNSWNQAFCTKACLVLSTNTSVNVTVSWDSEPGYDATDLEVDDGCLDNWVSIYGGIGVWDGAGSGTLALPLADPHSGTAKFRFKFGSDGAWSDQDGLWDTSTGAFILDDLGITTDPAATVVLANEDFELEAVGANDATDWETCTPPGYGDFAGLYNAITVVQEDPCASNLTCVWGFYNGSTYNYGCGGYPFQPAIPYENQRAQYILNEVWSPNIAVGGTGAVWEYRFQVYRDLPLSALIFYVWHVRTVVAGCPGGWDDLNFVYYGPDKAWLTTTQAVGQFMSGAASHVQLAIGIQDMCEFWVNIYGDCLCHSHSPLLDNVEFYRVAADGPQWGASRDLDQLQDNFSTDGTITGTARVDMANDILPGTSAGILPGDSACVTVADPDAGIATDVGGGPAVYCYVSIDGPNSGTAASNLLEVSAIPGRRHAITGNVLAAGGRNWIEIQMDSSFTSGGGLVPDRFNIDMNDNLFVPGDTCWYFYGARNGNGIVTYGSAADGWSGTQSANEAALAADEFTILPAEGYVNGGDVLYVDGFNFRGGQPFFDTTWELLGIDELVDRYDIRGPSSAVANHLGARVVNVFAQLIGIYKKIVWHVGDLTVAFGDGSGTPDKSPDCQLLFDFLEFNPLSTSGVYLSGDEVATIWQNQFTDASATALKTRFINHTVVTRNAEPLVGIAPYGIGSPPGTPPGGVFWKSPIVLGPDTLIAFGGCRAINTFDVIAPVVPALVEMDYVGNGNVQPAVVGQTTVNVGGNLAKFILSGFSYHYIRDDRAASVPDRVIHMLRILRWFDNPLDDPTGGDTPSLAVNELDQNYPNPFNPTTMIKYQIKDAGHVSLKIYNVAGQLVRTLVDEQVKAGEIQDIQWRGLNDAGQPVSSGVYFYKLISTNFTQTKKMVLLK